MDKKVVIKKFKSQIQSLGLLQFIDWSDIRFIQWATITKLYLINMFPDKKGDYLRNMYVDMLDKNIDKMPKYKEHNETNEKLALRVRSAKDSLQALLKAFIEVLEIDQEAVRWWWGKTKISIDNTQFNTQNVNIKQVIKNIITEVKKVSDDPSTIKEAEKKTAQLESELKKEPSKSNRDTIKSIIKRFADLWKDVLIAALPALLKHYWV